MRRAETLAAGGWPSRILSEQMSQEHVAVARRWVELFNERGDVDEFLSLHDPDVELQTPGGPRLCRLKQLRLPRLSLIADFMLRLRELE